MKQILALILASLLVAGCRKPDLVACGPVPIPVTPSQVPTTTIPASAVSNIALFAFFGKYGAPFQRRGFVIGQSRPILTASGAALSVAGVRFLYDNNTPAQDSAYLLLREVYRVPDMVLSDMPTMSQAGQLLISGGEFYMQVLDRAGRRLHVSPAAGGTPVLPLWQSTVPPDQDTTPQQYWQMPYLGQDWSLVSGTTVQTLAQATLPVQGSVYQVSTPLDTVLYHNIDQLYHLYQNGTPTSIVTVTAPTTAANETRVLLRPVGFNGLFRVRASTPTGTTTAWTAALPVGAALKAVVLQSVNGQLYFGTQQFTVSAATPALTPTLTPVSEADALALIRAL